MFHNRWLDHSHRAKHWVRVALVALAVMLVSLPAAAQAPAPVLQTEAKIQSAMSAVPLAIAKDATIVDYSAEGGAPFVKLRRGANGWACLPDWPLSPGNDPACYEKAWIQWNDAFNAGTEPNITTPGLAYMLQGGSDASNTDSFATAPAPGEDWVTSLAHVMLLFPGKLDTSQFTSDHRYGGPYVMWAGAPYEHIMMPVATGAAGTQPPPALAATGGAAVPWLTAALVLADLAWPCSAADCCCGGGFHSSTQHEANIS